MIFQNEARVSGPNDTASLRAQVHILGSICIVERIVFLLHFSFCF